MRAIRLNRLPLEMPAAVSAAAALERLLDEQDNAAEVAGADFGRFCALGELGTAAAAFGEVGFGVEAHFGRRR